MGEDDVRVSTQQPGVSKDEWPFRKCLALE